MYIVKGSKMYLLHDEFAKFWNFFPFLGRTDSVDGISNMLESKCVSHDPPPQSTIDCPPAIMMAPMDFSGKKQETSSYGSTYHCYKRRKF